MRRFLAFNMSRMVSAFVKSASGNGGVEFAMAAPILAALLVGTVDVGMVGYKRTDMHAATRAGAQYFMAGGNDFDRAAEIVRLSWSEMPEEAEVVVDRYCECSAEAASCNQQCPDGSAPQTFARVVINAPIDGFFGEYEAVASDSIRVR